jgi:hypothetical protein
MVAGRKWLGTPVSVGASAPPKINSARQVQFVDGSDLEESPEERWPAFADNCSHPVGMTQDLQHHRKFTSEARKIHKSRAAQGGAYLWPHLCVEKTIICAPGVLKTSGRGRLRLFVT